MGKFAEKWGLAIAGVVLFVAITTAVTVDYRTAAGDRATKGAPWTPSEMQKLRIENKQLKAGLVQREFSAVQQRWNDAVGAIKDECAAVVKENGWPQDMTCDIQTLQFKEVPINSNAGLDHKPGPAPPAKKP